MVKLKAERVMPLLIVLTLVIHQLVAMRLIVGTSNYNVMYETNYWISYVYNRIYDEEV